MDSHFIKQYLMRHEAQGIFAGSLLFIVVCDNLEMLIYLRDRIRRGQVNV